MKFLLTITVIFFVVNSSNLYAQSEEPISKDRYTEIYDSLSFEKANLLLEKKRLTASIDSLKNYLVELKENWESGRENQLKRKYGSEIGARINRGQIWKGMTEKMLEDSWGKPEKITKNKEKWGTFTQWYFGKITYFFKDGIMTGWEEIK